MMHYLRIACAIIIAITCTAINASAHKTTNGPLDWGTSCSSITFHNLTTCPIVLTLQTDPPGVIPPTSIPPGPAVGPIPTPSPTKIYGAISLGGNFYATATPGAAPPASVPATASTWIPHVELASLCCCDIWFDTVTCSCWIVPTSVAGPCRP
jgi:hypothetical protein